MFSFVVNLVLMIISFSLVFFIMSYLNIKMNVDLTFKPIYKPLLSEMLGISIATSNAGDSLYEYYIGKTNGEEIENIIQKIINTKYMVCIEDKCIGNIMKERKPIHKGLEISSKEIEVEESIIPYITKENKKFSIKVSVI